MPCRHKIQPTNSVQEIYSFFEILSAWHATTCIDSVGFLYSAHLCTRGKYVGALFLFTGLSSNGKDTINHRDTGSIPVSPFYYPVFGDTNGRLDIRKCAR